MHYVASFHRDDSSSLWRTRLNPLALTESVIKSNNHEEGKFLPAEPGVAQHIMSGVMAKAAPTLNTFPLMLCPTLKHG